MPHWEGIFDASLQPPPEPIWFSRPNVVVDSATGSTGSSCIGDSSRGTIHPTAAAAASASTSTSTAVWKPLRKCDCRLLNQRYQAFKIAIAAASATTNSSNKNHHIVYIDGGRKALNFIEMTMTPTYSSNRGGMSSTSSSFRGMVKEDVCFATWFVRYEYNNNAHGKDISISTTTANSGNRSSSNTSTGTQSQQQQQIEYKVDGTTVRSSFVLYPITNQHNGQRIEAFYQDIVQAMSTTTSTATTTDIPASVLEKELVLDPPSQKVQVSQNSRNDTISLRKVPNESGSWMSNLVQPFQPSSEYTLQRGYSPYTVPMEDIEQSLGPVKQVVFVIHGIGEALFNRPEIQITGLIEQTNVLRNTLQRKQYTKWKKQCDSIQKNNQNNKNKKNANDTCGFATTSTTKLELPPPPNRIEFIPIEWYHCIHGSDDDSNNNTNNNTTTTASTNDLMTNLQLVTLPTIPALRTIANDVVLDVLLYCTPTFCSLVLQTVTRQIQDYYTTLTQEVYPQFLQQGGQVSIVGHSLGSVIAWDILSIAKQQQEQQEQQLLKEPSSTTSSSNDVHTAHMNNSLASSSSYGPSLIEPMKEIIPFTPEYTLFLGSPIGLFLTLRNARHAFQTLTTTSSSNDNSGVAAFTLPTHHVYNIFHPSDPVAYRIEPLLMLSSHPQPPPEPEYLTVPGEDVRLHVKAIQFSNVVRKSLFGSNKNSSSSNSNNNSDHSGIRSKKQSVTTNKSSTTSINNWTNLLESAVASIGASSSLQQQQLSNNNNSVTSEKQQTISQLTTVTKSQSSTSATRDGPSPSTGTTHLRFPLGGNNNPRIDYCLQPLIVDNEYISAVTAHSCYLTNSDVQDFLIGILQ